MQPFVDEEWTPGFSVAVVQDGKAEFLGLGRVDPEDDGAPQPDTIYPIASETKPFTGTLLALAIGRGDVALETELVDLVPEGVTVPTRGSEPIRVKHLVTHHSGLPNFSQSSYLMPEPGQPDVRGIDADTLYRDLSEVTLAFEPGSAFSYSNMGMSWLGYELQRIDGASGYQDMLDAEVTEPLEMQDTVVEPSGEQLARLAPPFQSPDTPWVRTEWGALAPGGGLLSTGADLARWMQAQLEPPEGALGEAIRATQVELADTDMTDIRVGMAWFKQTWRDAEIQVHSGGLDEGEAGTVIFPEGRLGVSVLTNSSTGGSAVNLAAALLDEIRGKSWSLDPELDWPAAVPAIEVPLSTLEELEGHYRNGNNVTSLEVHDGKLYELWGPRAPGYRYWRLWPVAEDEYVQRNMTVMRMVVERDDVGVITGYRWLDEDGGVFYAAESK